MTGQANIEVRVGESRTMDLVKNLTRTQIVQYAGASGDYNPIHTDEVYATQVAGQQGVIAHGMLTLGMASRLFEDWFGPGSLVSFGGRFKALVRPGDDLCIHATVESIDHDSRQATLTYSVRNQDEVEVLAGTAAVRLSDW